jgi:hypothetical protein
VSEPLQRRSPRRFIDAEVLPEIPQCAAAALTPLAPRITGADRATRTGAFVATLGDKPIRNPLLEAA